MATKLDREFEQYVMANANNVKLNMETLVNEVKRLENYVSGLECKVEHLQKELSREKEISRSPEISQADQVIYLAGKAEEQWRYQGCIKPALIEALGSALTRLSASRCNKPKQEGPMCADGENQKKGNW